MVITDIHGVDYITDVAREAGFILVARATQESDSEMPLITMTFRQSSLIDRSDEERKIKSLIEQKVAEEIAQSAAQQQDSGSVQLLDGSDI